MFIDLLERKLDSLYIYIIILIFIELISFDDFVGNNLFVVCLFVCCFMNMYREDDIHVVTLVKNKNMN